MILCQKLKRKQREERDLGKARVNQERKRRKQDLEVRANRELKRKSLGKKQKFILKRVEQFEKVPELQNAELVKV